MIVLGGGPAGTATAILLARAGLRVAVLERTNYEAARVGETLPPEVCLPLRRLGVWESFRAASHLASPGTLSCWGGPALEANDFLFNPYGTGWHVDRRQFDRMLVEAARTQGATVFTGTFVRSCAAELNGQWSVEATTANDKTRLQANYLIDTLGRAPFPGGGARSLRYDRLIGDVAFLSPKTGCTARESRTLIEARPYGWWYSAPLPNGQLVLAWMTDADLRPCSRAASQQFFLQQLRESAWTRSRVDDYLPPTSTRRFAAHTYCCPAGLSTCLAAGDAAMAFDPLSGQGVLKALRSAELAAQVLLAIRSGDTQARQNYYLQLEKEFQQYLVSRSEYYCREQRWANLPFWARRHAAFTPRYPIARAELAEAI